MWHAGFPLLDSAARGGPVSQRGPWVFLPIIPLPDVAFAGCAARPTFYGNCVHQWYARSHSNSS